jgi:hypothetical protein
MRRRRAILDPSNVQGRLIKVGLLPTKIDKLGRAKLIVASRWPCRLSLAASN